MHGAQTVIVGLFLVVDNETGGATYWGLRTPLAGSAAFVFIFAFACVVVLVFVVLPRGRL